MLYSIALIIFSIHNREKRLTVFFLYRLSPLKNYNRTFSIIAFKIANKFEYALGYTNYTN